mmetsp:Transcript_16359/g.28617  ORF Transcript_16359/g.28617 Transcript_16359/m.28617 type:complete len:131 (+) Transcript_16359:200-592(+)
MADKHQHQYQGAPEDEFKPQGFNAPVDILTHNSTRRHEEMKKNPLVLIGMGATVTALAAGLFAFQRGDSKRSQFFMRMRILAQGGTFAVLLASMLRTTGMDLFKSPPDAEKVGIVHATTPASAPVSKHEH